MSMKEFLQVFVSESLKEFQEAFLEESPAVFWRHRMNPCKNSWGIPGWLSGEILEIIHVAIFLVLALREFLEIFEESLEKFVSSRALGGIPDRIH